MRCSMRRGRVQLHAVVGQQYLPDGLEGSRYYRPTGNGFEKQLASRLEAVRRILDERQHAS